MRTFAIGDIHGTYKALLQILDRSGFNKEEDTLISLGDVADGYSQVYECVEELLTIKNLIAIKGNHDDWTLQWIEKCLEVDVHKGQGGQATYDSYRDKGFYDIYSQLYIHYKFFKYQHDYYIDDSNRLFVHGGINRNFDISEGVNCHNYSWNRSLWTQALSCNDGVKLKTVNDFSEIFIGHTTTINWKTDKPMNSGGVWNLDTGAGFGGKLTIMDVYTKEYWQSDLVCDLYPNEQGRKKR